MRLSALPRSGPIPSVRIWGATVAGRALAHPNTGRAPGDRPAGVSMPDDAFTARRLIDGDWTSTAPSPVVAAAQSPPPDDSPSTGEAAAAAPAKTRSKAE